MEAEWSKLSEILESSRQEGKETAGLVRELGENIHQLADDFAVFKANSESHPSARYEDFGDSSQHPQDDLMAVMSSKSKHKEEAKAPNLDSLNAQRSPFDLPQYQEKQTDFLDEFGLGVALGNPNPKGDPKEDVGFDLPQGETDLNPKEDFDFGAPASSKNPDFMFDEMMKAGRKSPTQDDLQFSEPQNPDFDSPQDQSKKTDFDFFGGEKPKEDYHFEDQSPENKDFF
jgi:hypothetical protein